MQRTQSLRPSTPALFLKHWILICSSLLSALGSVLASTQAHASNTDLLQQIQQRQLLRVCIWPEYFAISYRNPRTGDLEGLDVELAQQLAQRLGVDLKFVDSSFAKLKANMQNGHCDIAMHGVGIRPDRQRVMDFAAPHLSSGIYAVVEKNNPQIQRWQDIDKAGHIVVVQKGTYMEPVMRAYLHQAQLSVVNSFKAREQEVLSGRADVFMTDYPYGQRMVVQSGWATLLAPPQALAATPYAFAVPQHQPHWLAYVNDFVADIKADGRLRAIAAKYDLLPIVAP